MAGFVCKILLIFGDLMSSKHDFGLQYLKTLCGGVMEYVYECSLCIWFLCNDRTLYMFVLVGYSVAGVRIVVVVRSGQMWVVWATACRCRVRQFVSGAQREQYCF